MSKYFRPWNIDQTLLLPPNVQDLVPKGHVSRFIVELVRESLDLKEITGSYVSGLGQARAGRCRPGPATVNTRGRLWAARLINNPRRTKIGHVEAFPVLHMRSLRKSATSGRLRLFFLGGKGG